MANSSLPEEYNRSIAGIAGTLMDGLMNRYRFKKIDAFAGNYSAQTERSFYNDL
jgi:hypothetical protein